MSNDPSRNEAFVDVDNLRAGERNAAGREPHGGTDV